MLIGTAGLYMAIYSFGGWVTHLGFAGLAVALLAVTLRMELPLLTIGFGAFLPAYQVVAGLCWVPNALWAEWYVRRTARAPLPTIAELRPA
jgi:hypothetical protein